MASVECLLLQILAYLMICSSSDLIYSFDFIDYSAWWEIIGGGIPGNAINHLNSNDIKCDFIDPSNHSCVELVGRSRLMTNLSLSGWEYPYLVFG